ncbi:hypothetical protein [Novosphingobium aquae]|uniref:Uncharacterized protein n=1 Tax=Novosphingobium aquae TaxID=3133435 RepID=A0ABU8S989_9SPHN
MIYRHLGNNAKIGVGFSVSDFSDELTNQSYTINRVFVNLLGKFSPSSRIIVGRVPHASNRRASIRAARQYGLAPRPVAICAAQEGG